MEKEFFEKLAREHNTTVENIRTMISVRIMEGLNNPDPQKSRQWERIPHMGEAPTPEEWLRYAAEMLEKEEMGDLLRSYIMIH